MYALTKSSGELAAFGLTPDDFATDEYNLWPENYQSYQVFAACSTQWRVGMNGPTGIDYNVLTELWRRLKVPISSRDDVFQDIRIMETAALNQIRENQATSD